MVKLKSSNTMFIDLFSKAGSLIDWKAGFVSGLIIGGIVFLVNVMAESPANYVGSLDAGIKQAIYTLFVGGFIQQISNWFALRPSPLYVAVTLATVIPGAIACSLVYFIHVQGGTLHPLLSTFPIIVLSLTIFPALAVANRNRQNQP